MALYRRHPTAVAMTDAERTGPERTGPEKSATGHLEAGHPEAGPTQAGQTPTSVNARARAPRPWRVALSLFTVLPAGVPGAIRRDTAAKALPWLPAVGAMVAAIAAGAMFAVQAGGQSEGRRLLAATLAVAILGLLTGGLHLDGLRS